MHGSGASLLFDGAWGVLFIGGLENDVQAYPCELRQKNVTASISDAELIKAIEALFDEGTRELACLTKSTPQAKKGSESNGSLPDDDCTAYS